MSAITEKIDIGNNQITGHPNHYQPRKPENTTFYQVIQENFATYCSLVDETQVYCPITPHVRNEFEKFMTCGILAHGFARAKCECGEDFLIGFSCKGKSVCPSCNGRRMVQTAAHLVDHVFPKVPVRQWVISFPKRLRYHLQYDNKLASRALNIFLKVLRNAYQGMLGTDKESRLGGVTFIHRFGSSLNAHLHFHICIFDGIFEEINGIVNFKPLPVLNAEDLTTVIKTTQQKVLKLFVRKGILEQYEMDNMLQWRHHGGFSIDASVQIHENDCAGLERLLRYCARPPFSMNRLHRVFGSDDKLIYQLPKPLPTGQTKLILTPLEFIDKLVKLVSAPNVHRHRYFGVLAPNSPMRKQVVSMAGKAINETFTDEPETVQKTEDEKESNTSSSSYLWAILMARIFEVFPLICPACGQEMQIIAFIRNQDSIRAILEAIGEPTQPPVLKPPRGPPDYNSENDQFCDYDITQTEPIPDYDFDQSVNW